MGFWMRVWLIRAKKKKEKEKEKEKRKGKERKRQICRLHLSLLFSSLPNEEERAAATTERKKKKRKTKKGNLSPIIQQRNPRPRHTPSLIKLRRQFRINF